MSDGEFMWTADGPQYHRAQGATALAALTAYAAQYGRRGTLTLAKCHRDGDLLYYVFGSPAKRGAYSHVYAWALTAR